MTGLTLDGLPPRLLEPAPWPHWPSLSRRARAQDVLGDTGIKGAGSTFAYPVLSRWSREYRRWLSRGGEFPAANAGLEDPPPSSALEYEPVGSLAGTLRVKDRAVDFGASDRPLTSPRAGGAGPVPVPDRHGRGGRGGQHRRGGPRRDQPDRTAAGRHLPRDHRPLVGRRIKALNPTLSLPDAAIAVVRRSDGSGTTFNFTDYLSQVSPEWKLKAGAGLLISWPTGTAAKGNEGVAQTVQAVKNSIGYVDYAQASQLKLRSARLQNRAGTFVRPDTTSFQAAAASADWGRASDFFVMLTNPRQGCLPHHRDGLRPDARGGPSAARSGDSISSLVARARFGHRLRLGYVPLPAALVKQVARYWATTFGAGS